MPDKDGYPTKRELYRVKNWNIIDKGAKALVEFIEEIWWYPERQIEHHGNRLVLHTGGWSGNEDIIDALMEQSDFWSIYWEKSIRGGHYYFNLRRKGLQRIWEGKKVKIKRR